MAIKIQGLYALNALCGGSNTPEPDLGDGLDGVKPQPKPSSSSAMLDKYTIQEKVVPLLRAIKTKEPAVMMAALSVFKQVAKVADADFLALEVLPCLWSFSLGPLLNLEQFKDFMSLIKSTSSKIEQEQMRKLSELSTSASTVGTISAASSFGGMNSTNGITNGVIAGNEETDFESLVTGRNRNAKQDDLFNTGWGSETTTRPANPRVNSTPQSATTAPRFSWQTAPSPSLNNSQAMGPARASSGTVTPDNLGSFATLTPSQPSANSPSSGWGQPLQPQQQIQPQQNFSVPLQPSQPHRPSASVSGTSIDWSAANKRNTPMSPSVNSSISTNHMQRNSSFGQPSQTVNSGLSNFSIAPPPTSPPGTTAQVPTRPLPRMPQPQQQQPQKQGLDKYESLI